MLKKSIVEGHPLAVVVEQVEVVISIMGVVIPVLQQLLKYQVTDPPCHCHYILPHSPILCLCAVDQVTPLVTVNIYYPSLSMYILPLSPSICHCAVEQMTPLEGKAIHLPVPVVGLSHVHVWMCWVCWWGMYKD